MKGMFKVENHHTALQMGSGDLPVLSTPSLIAFMEYVAKEDCQELCQEGQSSVGIKIQMQHLKPSIVGTEIEIITQRQEPAGKVIIYHIEAFAQGVKIGKAVHQRAIIDVESFLSKIK